MAFIIMNILTAILLSIIANAEITQFGPKVEDEESRRSECKLSEQTIYDFQVEKLDGTYVNLDKYRGKVLLIINVATYCAYTHQYNDFNPLLERNSNSSLRIIAFPCNQFHLQEPAENHEILNGIKYVRPGHGWEPHKNMEIFGKLRVNGDEQHPLYEHLKDLCPQTVPVIGKRDELIYDPIRISDITWNFEKFLIDKKGHVRYRFHPTAWVHSTAVQPFIDILEKE